MTAYMLMRIPTRNYRGYEAELVDIYLSKESAERELLKRNSYTREGRRFDYILRTKKVKE